MSTSAEIRTEEQSFLTPHEVSSLLHVSVQTVRRWIKHEDLPAYKVGPRMWRIRATDLSQWLAQQRSSMTAGHQAI
jgi:excisionase family DNA binding protein